MEITIQFLILVSFVSVLLFLKLSKKPTPNLPPGPWKLPLIGNLHNLVGAVPHRALHRLALKYGPVMHLQLGELSVVVITSPDAARQVMRTHDVNFASRPPIMAAEIMSYKCTSITFGAYGDYWRQLRKICALELLSAKRVQSFRSIREGVFMNLAREIASNEGSLVNLSEMLYSSTYAVTSRAALGKKTNERDALLEIIKEGLSLAAGFDVADVYPSTKWLQMVSRLRKRLERLHREADGILDGIIDEHVAAAASDEVQKQEDLLDVLLKFQDEGLQLPLTTDNVKSVVLDVLAAGSDTSATTVDWAMTEMLRNPAVMEKAQDEVRKVFDEKKCVDESLIQDLPYLKLVIKETLRMHAPLPLLLPRKCSEACEINGYDIPANTKVIVNAWAINRDPKFWKNPDHFHPERFANSSTDYKGNHLEYIPFGAGRRICPGISFGIANVELPLAMLLYHFNWNLPGGMKHEEMDMISETFGVTARRREDLFVAAVVRRSLPVE